MTTCGIARLKHRWGDYPGIMTETRAARTWATARESPEARPREGQSRPGLGGRDWKAISTECKHSDERCSFESVQYGSCGQFQNWGRFLSDFSLRQRALRTQKLKVECRFSFYESSRSTQCWGPCSVKASMMTSLVTDWTRGTDGSEVWQKEMDENVSLCAGSRCAVMS